jgi:hypothetical protein
MCAAAMIEQPQLAERIEAAFKNIIEEVLLPVSQWDSEDEAELRSLLDVAEV